MVIGIKLTECANLKNVESTIISKPSGLASSCNQSQVFVIYNATYL